MTKTTETQFVITGSHPQGHYRVFHTRRDRVSSASVNIIDAERFDTLEDARRRAAVLNAQAVANWQWEAERKGRW